jgi:hypothetical protein
MTNFNLGASGVDRRSEFECTAGDARSIDNPDALPRRAL